MHLIEAEQKDFFWNSQISHADSQAHVGCKVLVQVDSICVEEKHIVFGDGFYEMFLWSLEDFYWAIDVEILGCNALLLLLNTNLLDRC